MAGHTPDITVYKGSGEAFLVRGVLTQRSCTSLFEHCWQNSTIDSATAPDVSSGLHTGKGGGLVHQERRNFQDVDQHVIPQIVSDLVATIKRAKICEGGDMPSITFVGSPRLVLKLVRYKNGGMIPKHIDAIHDGEYYTVIVYLSEYKGGRTCFSDTGEYVDAAPGDMLCFEGHKIFHACEKVGGTKDIGIFTIPK
jgi:hypothetical protein